MAGSRRSTGDFAPLQKGTDALGVRRTTDDFAPLQGGLAYPSPSSGRQSGAEPAADRPPRRSGSAAGEPPPRRASNTGAAPNQEAAAPGVPRPSRDPPPENRRPSGSGGQPGGSRRPSVYPEVFSAAEANAYPASVHYPAVTDAPWREGRNSCAAVAAVSDGRSQARPQPPRPATAWPDAHGEVTSDDGNEKPPTYKAFAFNDAERADLSAAGGLGMLGYRYHRRTTVNWYAWLLFIFYLGALGYYLYIRITKTLDLGKYFEWYGILLLVVECMGASTVVIYGIWLLYSPVQEDFVEDPHTPGLPKVKLNYHVRVLVPCYKEDLEIIQKTVLAALDAPLPGGCSRTVYLCDDGKDPDKRAWIGTLGPDVVYVSGRFRKNGEMNGKSGNLNNCARQIYPPGVPIPGNELICIFDADQVARRVFFARTLPLFDAGDDVGMVLSPQCFHNLNTHTDIFNHSNRQFWEYMQPGYDAWGFISCTGTNFLMRAKAFMEAGGSPTYTLTEDFALGMEMKKYGWQCRYVQEYLAVGEAPDEIRNCFQQRSRWTKGHFQIILNPTRTPLFQWKLRLFDRLMYCSGCWSYTVGAVTTPVFIAIPVLTIWIGVFPVVISREFALALTIYTVATQLLLYYVRKLSHLEALWFANVANSILWWAFVKAWWRAFITRLFCCCAKMSFKATAKGKGRLANSAAGDIWLHCLAVIVLAATMAIGIWQLVAGAQALSPLLISVLWAAFAMVPPFLLVSYAAVGGPGVIMRILCFFCGIISTCAGLAAVGILWAIPSYNSKEFSGGLVSQQDIGVLFRYIHDAPQRLGR
ncbi:Cellulose synthase 1 [Coccomyxa sp. Obi]|nr:Cellulose synthase 1 [Coccomyxa sp. Obi]